MSGIDREFTVTGLCIPEKHYMADTTDKLKEIITLIDKGRYFIINKPRQYGKTTTLYMLARVCNSSSDYLAIRISFETMDEAAYKDTSSFIRVFLELIAEKLEFLCEDKLVDIIASEIDNIHNMRQLSRLIKRLVMASDEKLVLLIDEVDKSSNNQLFLDFLGMLRDKFLSSEAGEDYTFHSVILAGVHDVKNLKLKLRDEEEKKYNSPWNIATNFEVDLSLSEDEIASMLQQYINDKCDFIDRIKYSNRLRVVDEERFMNKEALAKKLYYYTSGYPFLVSKLCKLIDEKLVGEDCKWEEAMVDMAVKLLLRENNTNFQSLIKNLDNNSDFRKFIETMVLMGAEVAYVPSDRMIELGELYGFLREESGMCKIHNKIFEQYIYNHLAAEKAN